MTMLFAPLLAAALLGQARADRTIAGEVVDDHGKPVADAQVVFYAPPVAYGKGDPVEEQTRTGADGKFAMKAPRLERYIVNGVNFLAYQPGLAMTAQPFFRGSHRLVLQNPSPRVIKVEGPDGRPIAGAKLTLRLLHVFNGPNAEVPGSLAESQATFTGPDGTAAINYLAARDQLVAVRVTADAIGTQDISLMLRPGRDSQESRIVIRLKPTSHLAGRIVDGEGHPVVK